MLTPSESGTCNFKSSLTTSSMFRHVISISDENGTVASESGSPLFDFSCYLEGGKTYYIAVKISSGSGTKTGTIPFTISKL